MLEPKWRPGVIKRHFWWFIHFCGLIGVVVVYCGGFSNPFPFPVMACTWFLSILLFSSASAMDFLRLMLKKFSRYNSSFDFSNIFSSFLLAQYKYLVLATFLTLERLAEALLNYFRISSCLSFSAFLADSKTNCIATTWSLLSVRFRSCDQL